MGRPQALSLVGPTLGQMEQTYFRDLSDQREER